MRKSLALTLAAALLAAAPVAFAFEPGDIYLRGGATNVNPDDNNGSIDLSAVDPALGNQDIEVDDAWGFTFTVSYQWTQNWAVELLAAYPFEHDIKVEGVGKVGKTKQLPPTLSLQYHFMPDKKFQPYIGAGVNYTIFFDESSEGVLSDLGGDLDIDDNSWGLAGQVGFDYFLNDQWFVNLDLRYIGIETKAKVTVPGVGTIKEDVSIDPWVYGVNVGFKF
jgi:outer membrane protein